MISSLISRAEKLRNGLEDGSIMKGIVMEYEAELCDMNTERQLYEQGINRLGVKLSDFAPYSETTVMLKRIKGDPYDRVTLRDEGDFHGEWKVEADDNGFKLTSSDWKEELLGKHYGKEIYGLTEENAQEFTTEYIKPDLLRITREILLS